MEYTHISTSNINKYIDEFHNDVRESFANSLTKIYNAEINVYRDLIETVIKLPFIQEIINENNMLKAKLKEFSENNNSITLEIHDKPLVTTDVIDLDNVSFTKVNRENGQCSGESTEQSESEEEEAEEDAEEEAEEEDEEEAEEEDEEETEEEAEEEAKEEAGEEAEEETEE